MIGPSWQDISILAGRFTANCDALATRNPALAARMRDFRPDAQFVIAAHDHQLLIGRRRAAEVEPVACRLDPAGARQVAARLCPDGSCGEPLMVAGIDQGWLWSALYDLPVNSGARPGFRPPLWYLSGDPQSFHLALHLHEWREMLADPRVQWFIGRDALEQARRAMLDNVALPLPRLSVTLEPEIWPAGSSLDALTASVSGEMTKRLNSAMRTLSAAGAGAPRPERLAAGGLRILGITARYTTFLQHSMRDWLSAFEAMGHQTLLMMEQADHEQLNSLSLAEACVRFKPDLILLIDHFRAELGGLPDNVPCVMWLQDYLPNLFNPGAGAAQGPGDYVIGYNRTECTRRFGYPFERFIPAMVAVNEERFAAAELSEDDRRRFECDVCFVSHASRPAEAIVAEQIRQNGPQVKPLLADAFERLKSIYDAGLCLSHPLHVRQVIDESMAVTRVSLAPDSAQRLTDVFTHRVNNALLRHQMIEWAAQTGADLHLYGNGWENHPRFARYAKGPADNARDLIKIYRAARIHLQATPHGAVHQRLLEGLCAGGFFLVRYVPGDRIETFYQPLWQWCLREGITDDQQLRDRAAPEIRNLLGQLQRTLGLDPFALGMSLIDDLRTGADTGWLRSAAAVWPDQFDRIAFDSRQMVQDRIRHYLAAPDQRREISHAMRQIVLEKLTYRAANVRLLSFIARDLARHRTAPGIMAA